MKRSNNKIWITLFVLYVIYVLSEISLFAYYFISPLEDSVKPDIFVYLSEVLVIISLVGYYGYISLKKIGNVYFWRVLFVIMVTVQGSDIFFILYEDSEDYFHNIKEIWGLILTMYIIILSSYVALYLYSFKCKEIWLK